MPLLLKFLIVGLSLALFHGIDWEAGQYIFGIALMATIGIPHGATDHLLHNYKRKGEIRQEVPLHFTLRYLGLMALYAILWFLLPIPSLLLFLLISAYHFGETQWATTIPEAPAALSRVLYLCWGSSLLGSLFYVYPAQTIFYLNYFLPETLLQNSIAQLPWLIGITTLGWLLIGWRYARWQDLARQVLDAGILLVLILGTDLLIAFLVFFGLWHSLDAIGHQVQGLRATRASISWRDVARYAFPLSIISLLGIALLLGAWFYWGDNLSLVTLFFIAVSVLTLPHVWVMDRFYEHVRDLAVSKNSPPA